MRYLEDCNGKQRLTRIAPASLSTFEAHTRLAMQTIGFGDFHPETTEAKWCALLFVPIVVAATGYILGK